jgi:RNA polymerase-binding transcription factor DksA
MLKEHDSPLLTASQLETIRSELEYERRRLERSMTDETASAEHDDVIQALHRLDIGAYGICTVCQQTIPYQRLSVVPTTTHCIGCHD